MAFSRADEISSSCRHQKLQTAAVPVNTGPTGKMKQTSSPPSKATTYSKSQGLSGACKVFGAHAHPKHFRVRFAPRSSTIERDNQQTFAFLILIWLHVMRAYLFQRAHEAGHRERECYSCHGCSAGSQSKGTAGSVQEQARAVEAFVNPASCK